MLKSSSLRALLITILAYAALWLLAPKAHFLPKPLLVILGVIAFMAVDIAIVYYYSLLQLKWWQSLVALAACLAGAVVVNTLMRSLYPKPAEQMAAFGGPLGVISSVLIMIAAASIGCAVAVRVTDRNLLLPVVMFAACIDVWTVTRGPVAAVIHHAPQVARAVSVPIPTMGAGTFASLVQIGPGDFLFMGLVFAAISRLKMNCVRNYWFMFKMMTLGMLFVLLGPLPSLPALIMLAIAVVSANWREFKLSRQEAISTAVVGVVLLAVLPLVWHVLAPKAIKHPAKAPPVSAPADRR